MHKRGTILNLWISKLALTLWQYDYFYLTSNNGNQRVENVQATDVNKNSNVNTLYEPPIAQEQTDNHKRTRWETKRSRE